MLHIILNLRTKANPLLSFAFLLVSPFLKPSHLFLISNPPPSFIHRLLTIHPFPAIPQSVSTLHGPIEGLGLLREYLSRCEFLHEKKDIFLQGWFETAPALRTVLVFALSLLLGFIFFRFDSLRRP